MNDLFMRGKFVVVIVVVFCLPKDIVEEKSRSSAICSEADGRCQQLSDKYNKSCGNNYRSDTNVAITIGLIRMW